LSSHGGVRGIQRTANFLDPADCGGDYFVRRDTDVGCGFSNQNAIRAETQFTGLKRGFLPMAYVMKTYFRCGLAASILYCATSSISYAADPAMPCEVTAGVVVSESKTDVKLNSLNPVANYKRLKRAIIGAINRNDGPALAELYLIAKTMQRYGTISSSACGVLAGVSLVCMPFTFGLTAIAFVPSAAVCAGAAVGSHKYRKLKQLAKRNLAKLFSPDLYPSIVALKRYPQDAAALKSLLADYGYEVK